MTYVRKFKAGQRVNINGTDLTFRQSGEIAFHGYAAIQHLDRAGNPPEYAGWPTLTDDQERLIKLEKLPHAARFAHLRDNNALPAQCNGASDFDRAEHAMNALRHAAGVLDDAGTMTAGRDNWPLTWARAVIDGIGYQTPETIAQACRIITTASNDAKERSQALHHFFTATDRLP